MAAGTKLLHPAFAAAASSAAAHAMRRGPFTAQEGETYEAAEGGVTLRIRTGKRRDACVVLEAHHDGATSAELLGVVDTFCQTIEGLPLREAADHGAIHAMQRLLGNPPVRPVPGIITPRSAGTAFRCCEKLIRAIWSDYTTKTGNPDAANFWNPALSSVWRSNSDAERIEMLRPIVERFRAVRGLSVDALWIEAIEKTRRVIVAFGPTVGYEAKPSLLMQLEVDIRQATGDRLEIFMAEAKDTNSIRRLTQDEEAA